MNEIMINEVPVTIKEYQGQRVVTLKDIDTVHGRADGTARKRFNDNKAHFIEGEDYFKVCASEIRTHKIMEISAKTHEDMIFITESGYLMLVKSFTDDLAWNVQRQLVKIYFRAKEMNVPAESTTTSKKLEIQEMNARTRMANLYLKLADVDTKSGVYKDILIAKAAEVLA
ncbi:MAG: ORF6N domain-containing protein, partial [Oscillospiraceae bacterium]|nr:ORF6N domain-containing protein [Oscillospiraceae bacterium]